MTNKQKFLFDMHTIFMSMTSGDMDLTMHLLESLMSFHNVTYKEVKDINPDVFIINIDDMSESFEEEINSVSKTNLVSFSESCENFLNMDSLVKKDNAELLKRYQPVMIIEPIKAN